MDQRIANLEALHVSIQSEIDSVKSEIQLYQSTSDSLRGQVYLTQKQMDAVIKVCAASYKVSVASILRSGRKQDVAWARQTAMAIFREWGMTLDAIGDYFGKDHGTVHHAIQAVEVRKSWPDEGPRIATIFLACGKNAQ